MLNQKIILITGGTGSLGKTLVKQLLEAYPNISEIRIFSRDEYKQFEMRLKDDFGSHPSLKYYLGDIRDIGRLKEVCKGVDYVIHAAAIKQVSSAEYNQEEAYKTNVLGTQNVLEACVENKVKKLIAISSDKAVEPSNYYGLTKLKADEIILNTILPIKTTIVRFGNLLGSRASVLEAFEYQSQKGCLQVSDLDVIRFFVSPKVVFKTIEYALNNDLDKKILIPSVPKFKLSSLISLLYHSIPVKINGLAKGEKLEETLIDFNYLSNTIFLNSFEGIELNYDTYISQAKLLSDEAFAVCLKDLKKEGY